MNDKISLTSNDILNKRFVAAKKGYSCADVDSFLDQVIENFEKLEKINDDYRKLLASETKLKEEIKKLRIENALMKTRLDGINQNDNASTSNIDLIKRINALEKLCYKHGIDPTRVK